MTDEIIPASEARIWDGIGWAGVRSPVAPKPGVCRGTCADDKSFQITHFYGCTRKGKVARRVRMKDGTIEEVLFCGTHDPISIRAKREKRNAIYEARYAADKARWAEEARVKNSRPAFVDALRKIANGDNDPRTTAREVLGRWGEPLE